MTNRYLEILELAHGATESDIKKAYRRLAKIYHPDINKDKNAKRKFIEITEAYKFLTDVGPRPHQEHVSYDYNPYQREYDEWRIRARAYAKKKAREEAAAQRMLLNKIYFIFNYVAMVVVAFNFLVLVDYLLPPKENVEEITSISQIYEKRNTRRGSGIYLYDQVVFENFKMRVERDATEGILESHGTIYTSPIIGFIKYAEVRFEHGIGTLTPKYGIYNIFKLLVPLSLLICLSYYFMSPQEYNKISLVVVITVLTLIQMFLLLSFKY